ncbi:MAG: ATP-binding protein [Fimbriimonadaceae bacterium]|nr:ATP-binding protein [Fimbriimonadaceae bacterium]
MIRRFASDRLREALEDTPVVIVQGPRQCGKTTLVQQLDGDYVTLDDSLALETATTRPEAFLNTYPDRLILDEAQRAPGLFRPLKGVVDKNRKPGRFVLTGSSDVLLVPKASESLAGRMEVVPLWPLSQAEIEGSNGCFISWLLSDDAVPTNLDSADDWLERATKGGFPEPLSRKSESRRRQWVQQYLKAIIERDIRDLARIEGLASLPRLLRSLAASTAEPTNISALSRTTGLPHTTLTRYLALLEAAFLVRTIPAWSPDGNPQTTRTSKLVFVDGAVQTELAPHLDPEDRLEGFVAMEFVKLLGAGLGEASLSHFRSIRRFRVPFVLEDAQGRVHGIALTTSPVVAARDVEGLRFLRDLAESTWHRGVVLHTGPEVVRIEADLLAVPLSALWLV